MKDKIVLRNERLSSFCDAQVSYCEEEDKFLFDISVKGNKDKELAVLFVNGDDSFYTAEIIGMKKPGLSFSILKSKIAHCVSMRIVDIDTEREAFCAAFTPSAASFTDEMDQPAAPSSPEPSKAALSVPQPAVLSASEDCSTESEAPATREDAGENSEILSMNEGVLEDLKDVIESVEAKLPPAEDAAAQPPEEEEKNEIGFIAEFTGEEDASDMPVIGFTSEPRVLVDDSPNKEDISFHFPSEEPQTQSIQPRLRRGQTSAQGLDADVLINENESLLEDNFDKLDLFENPLKNHVFYAINEAAAKKKGLRIILNGYVVPLMSPFLEYKNPFGTDSSFPKHIVGAARIDDHTEYYVFGALARCAREEQPFLGATGFVYFEKLRDSEYGYWLSYINAKTGKISLPMKPKSIW